MGDNVQVANWEGIKRREGEREVRDEDVDWETQNVSEE